MERKSVNTFLVCENYCAASLKSIHYSKFRSFLSGKPLMILGILLLFSLQGFSQTKYEKEFRIRLNEVPTLALSFVDSMTFDSKVKWYEEIGLNQITIEAKAKLNKEGYSIEYSENGIFQDVEIEVNPNKIDDGTYSKITGVLSQRHKKYKIEKVQIQYTGDRNIVLMFLRENRNNLKGITINYEVIISTKMDGNYLMIEYLFSETGEYMQSNQIVLNRKDRIDY